MTNLNKEFSYQLGGCLDKNSPIYVERKADKELYNSLKKGEFCYVFNSRQMGKSSLRLRVKHQLETEGYKCASLDLTMIGGENLTPLQWYLGLASELWRSFRLGNKFNLKTWWKDLENLSPIQKLSQFIEDVLLTYIEEKIFIFIDEIDTLKSLNFSTDDFFALIRFCYNQRGDNLVYNRLNWALFGVTTPSELIKDKIRTPFNIGKAIDLKGFQWEEIAPLAKGLEGKIHNPEATLKEILAWTEGQPFLTQKLCKLVIDNSQILSSTNAIYSSESSFVSKLITEVLTNHSDLKIKISTIVNSQIIYHWQLNDHPEHLKTISDRITKQTNSYYLLKLYQQILEKSTLINNNSEEIIQLLLSGIISKQQEKIKISNPIYEAVFNQNWVKSEIAKICNLSHNTEENNCCQIFMEIMQKLNIDNLEMLGNMIAKKYPEKGRILLDSLKNSL
jgi:AAA-like domain